MDRLRSWTRATDLAGLRRRGIRHPSISAPGLRVERTRRTPPHGQSPPLGREKAPSLRIAGKRFYRNGAPLSMKGVTYGTFSRRRDGAPYPHPEVIARDFSEMAAHGVNAVRLYTPPPPDLLAVADDLGLGLFVGLDQPDLESDPPTTLRARRCIRDAAQRAVDDLANRCAGHPSVIATSAGNEIPVDVVRLCGASTIEDLLSDRVRMLHQALPEIPITYVNFPTTEFLEPEGLDFLSFNVFLESPTALRDYLWHLQILAQGRPLVISELGLAAAVQGEAAQMESLAWQLQILDELGCAGGFVFSWTDEWAVGDVPVQGWHFGLTREDRTRKPALEVVGRWCRSDGRDVRDVWPRVSVVVCAYNEERTIEECLRAACSLNYPDVEVIVCDDGSTDRTVELVRGFPVRLLELPHGGLSRARNAGWQHATGEIIAYLDADSYPDPDWLRHIVLSFRDGVAASGGSNLPVHDSGLVERAVAASPGAPREVLLGPSRAEHVPGCTLAVRREVLEELGGFHPSFTAAGDDVDLCWRMQDRGLPIAFAPAAQIFHHRRSTVRDYLRQQRGYGKAERLLIAQHPHRFNRLGHARWLGFLYGEGRLLPRWLRPTIYSGWAGTAPFQPIAHRRTQLVASWMGAALPLLLIPGLLAVPVAATRPVMALLPALVLLVFIAYGVGVGLSAPMSHREPEPIKLRCLIGFLHVAQPIVRSWGRLRTPRQTTPELPLSRWTGDRMEWLADLRRRLHQAPGVHADLGGVGAQWDLAVRRWGLVTALLTTATLWRWEPRWRLSIRPRGVPLAAGAATLVAAVGLSSAVVGAAGLAMMLAIGIDWVRTRRTVVSTVRRSTAAACSDPGEA